MNEVNVQTRNFKHESPRLSEEQMIERVTPVWAKMYWFMERGYVPHYFQQIFHSMQRADGRLMRFRHLVAGRRGGKTLSAAWDVLFYSLFPGHFHQDVHHRVDDRPIYTWALTKDYPTGRAAWDTFNQVCRAAGLQYGRDYKMNKGDRYFEFDNGSFVQFRTADDPESLRGAGLDILWIDEAAFIADETAYEIARPALSDKDGIVITTTTPKGKNWFYRMFWSDEALEDVLQGRVEYWSIDNPYFSREEWEYLKKTYHPMKFKQELMASFDSMAGKELNGEWLKYWTTGDAEGDVIKPPRRKDNPKEYDLKYFIGVDPAISLADRADRFAISIIGVTEDNSQVFLIDQWAGRIPFPEQVEKIQEWYLRWKSQGRGVYYVAVEENAYQKALVQQLERLPSIPPVIPVFSKGKKSERILRMAPLFKIGKVRIRKDHRDFINEWVGYDSELKNPEDDCLDSVEIALSSVGALLPSPKDLPKFDDSPAGTVDEWARRDVPGSPYYVAHGDFDEHMGADW